MKSSKYLILLFVCLNSVQLFSQDSTLKFAPSFRYCPDRDFDIAWENDLVAFRVYGLQPGPDAGLSGVDAWHKKVNYPILDKWFTQLKEGKSYHIDYGEGCDQYHVGKTRGVGGIGVWKNDQIVHSGLYEDWEVISQTQTKLSFRLVYSWILEDGKRLVENRIVTIENGSQLYSAESHFTKEGKPVVDLEIAIGLSTQNSIAELTFNEENGWMSAWHELGDNKGMIGTGIKIEKSHLVKMFEQSSNENDASHALAIIKTNKNGAIKWQAGFAWEGAGQITSKKEWNNYLISY